MTGTTTSAPCCCCNTELTQERALITVDDYRWICEPCQLATGRAVRVATEPEPKAARGFLRRVIA